MAVGLDAIVRVLEESKFRRLPVPLVVAGTSFGFDAAFIGTEVSQDLIIVGGVATEAGRLAQLVSGLNRSLDRLESRRPVSLVLVGPRPSRALLARLESQVRVMALDTFQPTEALVRDTLAILRPLQLPSAGEATIAPLDDVRERLSDRITDDHLALIDAARSDREAVREVLREYVGDAFGSSENQDAS